MRFMTTSNAAYGHVADGVHIDHVLDIAAVS
jgi:hypothetical protein